MFSPCPRNGRQPPGRRTLPPKCGERGGGADYLATVKIINAVLGGATGLVLFLSGVPDPVMWGTMVFLFHFAPYVGARVSTLVLTVVGLMNFPSRGEALLVPGSFVVLTILEGQDVIE